jgi:HEAT repeat protein
MTSLNLVLGLSRSRWRLRAASRASTLLLVLILASSDAHLGAQSVAPSMQQLTIDVSSPEARVRRQALRELGKQGPEALVLLGRLIRDREVDIREKAIATAIGFYVRSTARQSIGSAQDAFMLAPYRTTPYPVPPELSAALIEALGDDYESVRRDAAYAAGVILTPPAQPAVAFELVASLSDRFPSVRIAAAQALGRLRVQAAAVPLIGRINDEVLDVRLAAMRAVGDVRAEQAVVALAEQFAYYVRGVAGRAAIDALARIGSPQSRPLFEAQTESRYPAHRRAAYEGLARLGNLGPAAPRIQMALAKEKDERVQAAMAFALTRAGHSALERIFAALGDSDTTDQALEYLVELGPKHAAEIAARLQDRSPLVREQIAITLGFIGGQEAAAALNTAASDENADVRLAVSVAQLRLRQGPGRASGS